MSHCTGGTRRTVGQIPNKCKETSKLMWLSMIWFILVLFACWNLICTIASLRIKCVTETQKCLGFFYKNVKSSFSTWLTHLTLRFFLHSWLLWPTVRYGNPGSGIPVGVLRCQQIKPNHAFSHLLPFWWQPRHIRRTSWLWWSLITSGKNFLYSWGTMYFLRELSSVPQTTQILVFGLQ